MKKKLVIFGVSEIAQLAHFYFSNDSEYEVVAFTVDEEYISEEVFCGLPVIPFEKVDTVYSIKECEFFVALSYTSLNLLRKEKYNQVKSLGYKLASFISSHATVLNGSNFGDNCFILEDNTIQPFVNIGNNVTLWSGNHIGHHSTIKDHAFISSHVVVSGGVEIGEQCFIGVNATLRDHIKIDKKCVIVAGSLILTDAEEEGLYKGSKTVRSKIPSTKLGKL